MWRNKYTSSVLMLGFGQLVVNFFTRFAIEGDAFRLSGLRVMPYCDTRLLASVFPARDRAFIIPTFFGHWLPPFYAWDSSILPLLWSDLGQLLQLCLNIYRRGKVPCSPYLTGLQNTEILKT